jgi:hypothetical protein
VDLELLRRWYGTEAVVKLTGYCWRIRLETPKPIS